MWIYLNNSQLSIVAHLDQPDALLVRSRSAGDIEAVFPEAEVDHTPTWDYAYRAVLPRDLVGRRIGEILAGIAYTNFKNSVVDSDRHNAYYSVYNATLREAPRPTFSSGWAESSHIYWTPDEEQAEFDWDAHLGPEAERVLYENQGGEVIAIAD